MKFTIYLLLFCSLLATSKSQAQSCKPIIAVYPSWHDSPSNQQTIRWDKFDYLAIASIYPLADGALHTDSVDHFIDELVSKAKAKNKRVIISVGGSNKGSQGFIAASKDEAASALLVKNIVAFAVKHRVDGVDIDWEYWTYQNELRKGGNDPIESAYLVKLLQQLRAKLPNGILLTTDIFAGNWVGKQYLPELQNHVDYVNLMAYDFTGAWPSSPVAHHADYPTFKKAIDFVIQQGFEKSKLIVGIPSYGIQFIDGKNKQIKHVSYREILKKLDTRKSALTNGKYEDIYFETPNLVTKKIHYINDKKLAGVMFFELLSDSEDKQLSLLNRIKENLKTSQCNYGS
ncbi:glycosyl hydrolase family 18 protein [Pseudoalteromonas sp. T1lg65]|uniref:glycosyl hydrolase family 18 protein n=1 Tax=Pseudoalteromonas sp. T1lg65 TaxID=2077101 RepID=UPI003F7AD132